MNILLTFDYELYFGESTGTQQKCIIKPTDELIKIAERHNICYSFFADCGYLEKSDEYKHLDPNLADDYKTMTTQLKYLAAKGHDVQLHIHPHWEDTVYDGKKWAMNTSRYRLHQFSDQEISAIFTRYGTALKKITGQPLHTFRAGGWCLQPFDKLVADFKNMGIVADSSVFKEGYEKSEHYFYDFRYCPDKDWWKFEDNPVSQKSNGSFVEIPISSAIVSPIFFWKLYLLGRLNPAYHKPIGDGKPMLTKGYKKRILSRYTRQVISTDGYNASQLEKQTQKLQKAGAEIMVIIGHPKALSPYSLDAIDSYVEKNRKIHNFITYSDFIKYNLSSTTL